ncbi:MAG: cell division protein FtsA [Flavobacteriales bacterium]|nr:cell division protein FtsA [Bacteroidota bacterium]MCB9240991.1 cell division protein FtsA [Flavobacteriales bacterium]
MTNGKIIVGLDIGTTKICAIVGRMNEYGKVDILGKGQVPSNGGVTRGVVSNIDKTVTAINEAVKLASEHADVDINRVHVGIAGAHIRSLQHRGMVIRSDSELEITKDDLLKLEQDMYKLSVNPGDKIIHVLPQDYTVDDEPGIVDPIGMAGVKLEGNFHIITGQITAAKNIYKCVEKAGIKVAEIMLEPLASSHAVLSDEELEAGVALVDIGGGTTDVAIFHENIIRHTAIIPYGGNIITEDIKEGCNVMKNQAELLKTRFGSALADESTENEIVSIPGLRGREPKEISVRNLARIINARVEEILELVYYEIKASGLEKKLVGGLVITGGGAQLKNITQLAEYVTGLDTRIGYPNEHLAKGLVEEVKSPVYATGVGLVLKGLDESGESGNIIREQVEHQEESIPEEVLSEKAQKKEHIFRRFKDWLKDESDIKDF